MKETYILVKKKKDRHNPFSYWSAELCRWMVHPIMASEYNSKFVAECVLAAIRGDHVVVIRCEDRI